MKRLKVVVAEPIREDAVDKLRAAHDVVLLDACDPGALQSAVHDAQALIVRTYAQVTAEVIAAAPDLRVIARAGIGVENIDLKAARQRQIPVVYRPTAATSAVAELTIGLLIGLERRVFEAGPDIAGARFREQRSILIGRPLSSLTLGIVGCGRIGSLVARMAHDAFGMPILFTDIRDVAPTVPATSSTLDTLLASADVVSLHVPLTADTRGLIDTRALARMKHDALLINTARGAVIDARAVAEALRDGRLGGAAIDVFDPEPPAVDHPLLNAPRCLLTPHIAARTPQALAGMSDVVEDVLAVLAGKPPQFPFTDIV